MRFAIAACGRPGVIAPPAALDDIAQLPIHTARGSRGAAETTEVCRP